MNHDDSEHDLVLQFSAVPGLPVAPTYLLRDVWNQNEIGSPFQVVLYDSLNYF